MPKTRGFTLLETILATLFLAAGLGALICAFSSGISGAMDTEQRALALNIADANMEMLQDKTYTQVDTSAEVSALISNLGYSNYSVSCSVSEVVSSWLVQIGITVSWAAKGEHQETITLTTLKANY